MNYSCTRAEQETIIRWDEADKTVVVYTTSPSLMKKLDKLTEQFPDVCKCTRAEVDGFSKRYALPAGYVTFRKPPTAARIEAGKRLALANRKARENP